MTGVEAYTDVDTMQNRDKVAKLRVHSPSALAENHRYAFKMTGIQPEVSTHLSKWGGRLERYKTERTMILKLRF